MRFYVIFDGPPGPESGRFVEVETVTGQGCGPKQTGASWEAYPPGTYSDGFRAAFPAAQDSYWRLGPFVRADYAERLKKARRYVRHLRDCDALGPGECSCGLRDIWKGYPDDDPEVLSS